MNKDIIEATDSFIEIAKKGSITSASQSLNISANTLRKRLAYLENYLNKSLLISNPDGYSLSEQGWQYFYSMQPILEGLEDHANSFYHGKKDRKLKYNIFTSTQTAVYIAKHILKDALEVFPDYSFDIFCSSFDYSMQSNVHFRNLINSYDLLLINASLKYLLNHNNWDTVLEKQTIKLKLYASKDYIDQVGGIQNIKDLQGLNFISKSSEGSETGNIQLVNNITNEKFEIQFKTISIPEIEIVKIEQILQGIGVGLIEQVAIHEGYTNDLIELLPGYTPTLKNEYLVLSNQKHKQVTEYFKNRLIKLVESDAYFHNT